MTDATAPGQPEERPATSILTTSRQMKRRNAAERRFKLYGMIAVGVGVAALIFLLVSILERGLTAFQQTHLTIPIELDAEALDPEGNRDPGQMSAISTFSYRPLIESALVEVVRDLDVEIEELDEGQIGDMISREAPAQLRQYVLDNPEVVGTTIERKLLVGGRIDGYLKGRVTMASAVLDGNVTPAQLRLAEVLEDEGYLVKDFNWNFIFAPDASDQRPEAAGLGVAGFILGGRDDASYVFTPQASVIVTLPPEGDRAPYLLFGVGGYFPFSAGSSTRTARPSTGGTTIGRCKSSRDYPSSRASSCAAERVTPRFSGRSGDKAATIRPAARSAARGASSSCSDCST